MIGGKVLLVNGATEINIFISLNDAMHGFSSDDEGVDLLVYILDGEKQSLSGHEVKKPLERYTGEEPCWSF